MNKKKLNNIVQLGLAGCGISSRHETEASNTQRLEATQLVTSGQWH